MKKILVCLLVMVCLLSLGILTYGASGSAVIPNYIVSNNPGGSINASYFYISNLTNDQVSIKVTFFKQDGSVLRDSSSGMGNGNVRGNDLLNYNETDTSTSASFTLGANQSGSIFLLDLYPGTYGYGFIEWEQDSKTAHALIADGFRTYQYPSGAYSRYSVPINNGLPF